LVLECRYQSTKWWATERLGFPKPNINDQAIGALNVLKSQSLHAGSGVRRPPTRALGGALSAITTNDRFDEVDASAAARTNLVDVLPK
jgi:hypothetical protein